MKVFASLFTSLVVVLAGTYVEAGLINSFLDQPGLNSLEDRDVEWLVDGTGYSSLADAQSGDTGLMVSRAAGGTFIGIGSQLEAVLVFESVSNNLVGSQVDLTVLLGSAYELTAHSIITVTALTNVVTDILGVTFADFAFTNGFNDGSAIRIYEQSGPGVTFVDFSDAGGIASIVADATDGDLLTSLGLVTMSDFWTAAAGVVDISQIDLLATGANAAQFFAGLSEVASSPGIIPIAPLQVVSTATGGVTIHDVVLSGQAQAPLGTAAGIDAQTNTAISFRTPNIVPEPSTFLIWAGAAAGLLVFSRRRTKG